MNDKRPLLLGVALPLFIAPIVGPACNSDATGGTTTSEAASSASSSATAASSSSSAGSGGSTSSAGGGGAGGDGGTGGDGGAGGSGGAEPACGDGTPTADQMCFALPSSFDGEIAGVAIAIGDMDGEHGDLVVASTASVVYFEGDGAGSFGSAVSLESTVTGVSDIALGQLDDGDDLDVVIAHNGSNARVVFGNGEGGVVTTENTFVGEGPTVDVHVADIPGSPVSGDIFQMNQGGCGGLHVTSGTEGENSFLTNSNFCNAPFGNFGVLALTGADTMSGVRSASGEGQEHLLHVPLTYDSAEIGQGETSTTLLEATTVRLATGDLDGDGFDDVIALVEGDLLNVLFSDGENGWRAQGEVDYVSIATGSGSSDLAVGDLDGDGDLDVVVANGDDDTLTVHVNDGEGSFTPFVIDLAADAAPSRIAVGDLNGDDVGDIAVVTGDSLAVVLSDP